MNLWRLAAVAALLLTTGCDERRDPLKPLPCAPRDSTGAVILRQGTVTCVVVTY